MARPTVLEDVQQAANVPLPSSGKKPRLSYVPGARDIEEETSTLDEGGAINFTYRFFCDAVDNDPERLFYLMNGSLDELLTNQKALAELQLEYDDAVDHAIKLRDQIEAIRRGSVESTGGTKKSTRLPDPEVFTGQKDKGPTFEAWNVAIQGKLSGNSDHYTSDSARMYYVYSRTSGEAQEHLIARYNSANNAFEEYAEMMLHLAGIYDDPHKKVNAKRDYKGLEMKKGIRFHEFYSKFVELAGKADIHKSDLMEDLYEKLTPALKYAIMATRDQYQNLEEMSKKLSRLDNDAAHIRQATTDKEKKNEGKDSAGTSQKGAGRYGTKATGYTQGGKETKTDVKPKADYDIDRPETRTCYKCNKAGHLARNCKAAVAAVVRNTAKVVEIDTDEQSENDSA